MYLVNFPRFFLESFTFLHLNFFTTLYENYNRTDILRIKNKLRQKLSIFLSSSCSGNDEKRRYIMYNIVFFERGWLVTQMLTLAYGGGTPNAYFCKQGYLVGQK